MCVAGRAARYLGEIRQSLRKWRWNQSGDGTREMASEARPGLGHRGKSYPERRAPSPEASQTQHPASLSRVQGW